jgi:hypothetical protein
MKHSWLSCTAVAFALTLPVRARADLPSFLRTENRDVTSGNEALNKGDAKAALGSYDRAARKLPDAPGVNLNRGLALLKQGEYGKAREALLSATVPSASPDIRADAYQDLALSFYREADGLAGESKHEEAQKLFREAVDASKRALHLRPNDPNTAWNLELAARRVHEEEQKHKEQQEKEQQEKKDKEEEKDKDKQDGDDKSDQQKSDDQKPDDQKQDDQKKPDQDDQKKPDEPQSKQDDQKSKQDKNDKKDPAEPDPQQDDAKAEKPLPREASQALDSLKDSEENFERYRARQRANRERRAPEKDW